MSVRLNFFVFVIGPKIKSKKFEGIRKNQKVGGLGWKELQVQEDMWIITQRNEKALKCFPILLTKR